MYDNYYMNMLHYSRFIEGHSVYSPPKTETVAVTQQDMLCESLTDIEEPIPVLW